PRRTSALRAGHIHKLRHARQRRSALLRNFYFVGQDHRQLLIRNRNQPILLAVNHWNRRTPIPLAAYAPILQPEDDLRFAEFTVRGNLLEELLAVSTALAVIFS